MTVVVTIALVAGLAIVWVRVVQTLKESPSGPRSIGQPEGLTWDGRVFTTPTQLKRYLSSQGLSYSRWVARHPTAFGGTAPARRTHTPKKTATKAVTPKPKPVPHRVASPPVTATKTRPFVSVVLTVLLLLAGLVIAGSALVPRRYVPVAVQQFYSDPDRRTLAVAAGAAILLGFGVSFYFT